MERNLTKEQWYNLYHSYRWQASRTDHCTALAWIASFNWTDAALLASLHLTGGGE